MRHHDETGLDGDKHQRHGLVVSCGKVCEEIAGDWWRLERSRVDVPLLKHNSSFVPVSQVSQVSQDGRRAARGALGILGRGGCFSGWWITEGSDNR